MSFPAPSCPACGGPLTNTPAEPDKAVCSACGAVYGTPTTATSPSANPFSTFNTPGSSASYRRSARARGGRRPRLVSIVFALIGVQLLIVTALAVGVWYWRRPKADSGHVAAANTSTQSSGATDQRGPQGRKPNKKPHGHAAEPDEAASDSVKPEPDTPITPPPPPPDDPEVPALVTKLKTADYDNRLKIIGDLSDKGGSARKAVPALIGLLKQNAGPVIVQAGADPAPEVQRRTALVTALLKAIHQIGVEPSLFPSLLNDLKGKDDNVATASAYVLGVAGEPAVDQLLPLLHAKDATLRVRGLRALFYCPTLPDRVLQPVIDRLADENEAVRQAAPGVLIHLGARAAPAVPALIKAVQARRVLAAMALGAIGPAAKDAVPALRQALADKKTTTDLIGNADPALSRLGITKPSLAGAAAAALEQIGPAAEPAIPELIATLKHPQADARYQAAHALGRLASDAPEVPPALARVMRDDKEDPLIRAEAIEALGQLGKAALPSLIDGLKLRLADLRAAAARNLGRIAPLPPEAIKALAHVLADPEPAVRMASARVLSQAADQALPTIGELERALLMKGQTAEVVDALAQALANLGDKGSAVLLKGLSAQSPAVRRGCARALGMTASLPTGAIHALTEAVNDTDEGVRVAAAEALGRLGPDAKAALPVLKQHADKDPSATVRQAAADAVARIVPS